ncbi:hypothetical protein [Thermococcus sp.]|uniref:hypothetical protein n=1 Tax=Thermococcus sp. TaxID=35749 RepID=UPI00260F89E3|nr:hypothetical protein [Thermococcus sp.]
MVALKKLYAGAILLLVVFATGCIGTSTDSSTSKTSSPTSAYHTENTQQWTPKTWTAYDKDLTLDREYYIGDIELTHTSKITMNLNIFSGANSISYLAIIPASELEKWKEDSTSITYEFITHHAKSGTYTATLSPGKYYVLVGIADPIHKTLASGTEVIKAGEYVGVPIDLSNIVYAEKVMATVDIREDLDINMFFTTAEEFRIYQEGGTPKIYTSYQKIKSGTYDLINGPPSYATRIGPDIYYLVLDNTYSLITTKTVDYTVTADVVYPARVHLKIEVEETG